MRKIIGAFFLIMFFLANIAIAKDVHVDGYYRKDGTYVSPHIRSSPDSSKANNYGPSRDSSELMNPQSRDNDNDGTPNYLDNDDNNDGISDDNDPNQYSDEE
ncbi:MAG: hypothetical protein FP814_04325 [Desulfobacterium sp.]|nr:hypothetical protein [Desulfobacteraceae bacterium]MBA3035701.1 hypothetical protein [Desulfobacterium sp.]MBU3948077.1 hypothetical protein [Pseudomonadota bacterium]MBU4034902.1 hypothetical protein [Pseudomonadota bacterium]